MNVACAPNASSNYSNTVDVLCWFVHHSPCW